MESGKGENVCSLFESLRLDSLSLETKAHLCRSQANDQKPGQAVNIEQHQHFLLEKPSWQDFHCKDKDLSDVLYDVSMLKYAKKKKQLNQYSQLCTFANWHSSVYKMLLYSLPYSWDIQYVNFFLICCKNAQPSYTPGHYRLLHSSS